MLLLCSGPPDPPPDRTASPVPLYRRQVDMLLFFKQFLPDPEQPRLRYAGRRLVPKDTKVKVRGSLLFLGGWCVGLSGARRAPRGFQGLRGKAGPGGARAGRPCRVPTRTRGAKQARMGAREAQRRPHTALASPPHCACFAPILRLRRPHTALAMPCALV